VVELSNNLVEDDCSIGMDLATPSESNKVLVGGESREREKEREREREVAQGLHKGKILRNSVRNNWWNKVSSDLGLGWGPSYTFKPVKASLGANDSESGSSDGRYYITFYTFLTH